MAATFVGSARSRSAAPVGYTQWVLVGEVARGSALTFGVDHHDEAIYVESGEASRKSTASAVRPVERW